jgi:hypothetical protein
MVAVIVIAVIAALVLVVLVVLGLDALYARRQRVRLSLGETPPGEIDPHRNAGINYEAVRTQATNERNASWRM